MNLKNKKKFATIYAFILIITVLLIGYSFLKTDAENDMISNASVCGSDTCE